MGALEKDWKKEKDLGKTPRKGLNPGQNIVLLCNENLRSLRETQQTQFFWSKGEDTLLLGGK